MTKRLNHNDLLQPVAVESVKHCVQCGGSYKPQRSTRKYCSDKCRQYYNRTMQNASSSLAKRREQKEYYSRVNFALELYWECTPQDRAAWLQAYIDNPTTKKIVCNPDLLRASDNNIAKVCHHYVMETYGVSIKDYY